MVCIRQLNSQDHTPANEWAMNERWQDSSAINTEKQGLQVKKNREGEIGEIDIRKFYHCVYFFWLADFWG